MENYDIKQSTKICSKCKKEKGEEHFKPERKLCNKCLEEKSIYREKNKEQLRQKAKEYYHNNHEKEIARTIKYKQEIMSKLFFRENNTGNATRKQSMKGRKNTI